MTESRRRPIRLKGYDYSQPGGYFVTIVTQNRLCLFGEVVGEKMHLNEAGIMIREIWKNLPRRFPTVELDVFVVMPNHIHGILQIHEPVGASLVGALDGNPGSEVTAGATDGDRAATRAAPTGVALGGVIGAYKSITTVEYTRGVKSEKWRRFSGRLWQRNYYEHIVRDEDELVRAREYIVNNPLQWALDGENPEAAGSSGQPW